MLELAITAMFTVNHNRPDMLSSYKRYAKIKLVMFEFSTDYYYF